jgi:hypothetical protein
MIPGLMDSWAVVRRRRGKPAILCLSFFLLLIMFCMSNIRKVIESGKCTIFVPEPEELVVKLHTMPTKFLKYEAWEPLEVRCDGYSHQMWNLASAYAEAFGLNRTLILPDTM